MARKTLFWIHLIAGLIAGVFIAAMCVTGALMSFEKQLLAWAEADVRRVEVPAGAVRLPLTEIQAEARAAREDKRPSSITVSADPAAAVAVTFGRDDLVYVNPYTAAVAEPSATTLRSVLKFALGLHRWLALEGEARDIAKLVIGIANLFFLCLIITGIILWWPRSLTWRGFKAVMVLNLKATGKARDWNWHNSLGFWALPILAVISFSAIPISFRWGGTLVSVLAGESPSAQQGPGGAPQAPTLPAPSPGTKRLDVDALLQVAANATPEWKTITLRLEAPQRRGQGGQQGGGQREGRRTEGEGPRREGEAGKPSTAPSTPSTSAPAPAAMALADGKASGMAKPAAEAQPKPAPQALGVSVSRADAWPRTATTSLWLNPYTGQVLSTEHFSDQTASRRLRTWLRYLHTGEALGWPGQLAALLGALTGLVLVYTGFALSWRRFFRKKAV